jgi:hypothetical protein
MLKQFSVVVCHIIPYCTKKKKIRQIILFCSLFGRFFFFFLASMVCQCESNKVEQEEKLDAHMVLHIDQMLLEQNLNKKNGINLWDSYFKLIQFLIPIRTELRN